MTMTPYQLEELDNIRRAAERGKAYNERSNDPDLDVFVHILDLVQRIKTDVERGKRGE
jgi:hypothetical protein